MNLYEHEGKKLFSEYGIAVPAAAPESGTIVLKAQVRRGDRAKEGGIRIVDASKRVEETEALLRKKIGDETVSSVLAEEFVPHSAEYYLSLSYDTATRGPVLALSVRGGSGIADAKLFPVDIIAGLAAAAAQRALREAGFPPEDEAGLTDTILALWRLFITEYALVAEINPLFKTERGFIAGDAKVVLDDAKVRPGERPYIEMDGDIAVLASGGGASMLAMDALLRAGGRPANYTEYSGNPSAEVVKALTKRVLSRPGLKGCFVVGAAANFTDIHATLSGFLEGLRDSTPGPAYPILIRRDGPRRQEAFEMLRAAQKEGFDFHLFDAGTPIAQSAKRMVELAYRT